MPPALVAYIAITFVLVITPGATTAVVVRNALRDGWEAGLTAAAGAAAGNATHATAAGLGLAILVARWPLALAALRVAGAIYLAGLGLVSLYRVARLPDGGIPLMPAGPPSTPPTPWRHPGSFRQGLMVNLLNPSIATFYLVVVPTFLPSAPRPGYFAGLAAIHIGLAFACHSTWALALGRLRQALHPPGARRLLEAVTGVALLVLAARVWWG